MLTNGIHVVAVCKFNGFIYGQYYIVPIATRLDSSLSSTETIKETLHKFAINIIQQWLDFDRLFVYVGLSVCIWMNEWMNAHESIRLINWTKALNSEKKAFSLIMSQITGTVCQLLHASLFRSKTLLSFRSIFFDYDCHQQLMLFTFLDRSQSNP